MIRIHHLVIDGGSMGVLYDLLSDEPKGSMTVDVHPYPQPRFGKVEMLARELIDTARLPVTMAKLGAGLGGWAVGTAKKSGVLGLAATPLRMIPGDFTRPVLGPVNSRLKAKGVPEVTPWMPAMRAPDMPFNGRMTSRRTYAFASLPLEDFRRVGKLLGGTINDAVLGVSAGAVRRFLQERHLPADPPLVVNIPVSIRTGKETAKWANYVFMIFAEFPTHLSDPVARVRSASASVKQSRASFDALPVGLLPEAGKLVHPALLRGPFQVMSTAPDRMQKMHYNIVVSNVRGPSEPMYFDGVRLVGDWPASFLAAGGGINITLKSYLDQMHFGFMGCPEQIGDLSNLVDYMRESLAETLAAAEAEAAKSGASAPPRKRLPRNRVASGARLTAVQPPAAQEG
jgi:WS/DGAT/MGAT family acyltransferase